MKKQSVYYIDNKKLLQELSDYKKSCHKAKRENKEPPIPNQYIGECILLLSRRIGTRSCFSGYSFLDEMISDGIENSIQYGISNFDPKRSNPFSYFTQIITWAFIRRIQKEKKQQFIKIKSMQNHHLSEQLADNQYLVVNNRDFDDFIAKFEESMAKKKQKRANTQISVKVFIKSEPVKRTGLVPVTTSGGKPIVMPRINKSKDKKRRK